MQIKTLLWEQNKKTVELAKHLGIDPSQASLIVNGWKKIPEKHLKKIAEFLAVPEGSLKKVERDGSK